MLPKEEPSSRGYFKGSGGLEGGTAVPIAPSFFLFFFLFISHLLSFSPTVFFLQLDEGVPPPSPVFIFDNFEFKTIEVPLTPTIN